MTSNEGDVHACTWYIWYSKVTGFNELCAAVINLLCDTSVIIIKKHERIIKFQFDVPYTKELIINKLYENCINIDFIDIDWIDDCCDIGG